MVENDYSDLFERICQKCRQRHCYGSDSDYIDMNRFMMRLADEEESADEYQYDNDGNEHKVGRQEQNRRYERQEQSYVLLRTGFAYSPATEAQLRATEDALGFALPPQLFSLYAHVANGGFGPAHGIIGVQGGFPVFITREQGADS